MLCLKIVNFFVKYLFLNSLIYLYVSIISIFQQLNYGFKRKNCVAAENLNIFTATKNKCAKTLHLIVLIVKCKKP